MAILECVKQCAHPYLDEVSYKQDHTVLEDVDGKWRAKCDNCGHESIHEIPKDKVHKHVSHWMRYPRYCASTDQTFSDKHAERQYVKKNSLEAL